MYHLPSACFNTELICASLNRPFFIEDLLKYLAEKIPLVNTTNFRGERWSYFFDQFAALLRWIRFSFQAANLIGSVLLAYASSGGKIPWVECGRSVL